MEMIQEKMHLLLQVTWPHFVENKGEKKAIQEKFNNITES